MSRVLYETAPPPPPRRSRTGCWLMTLLMAGLALLVGGIAAVALYWAGEPNNIEVELSPSVLTLMALEPATLTISIENVGLDPVTVTGIGLEPDLLAAVRVAQTEPLYQSITERSYPVYGEWQEFRLDTVLQPGAVLDVTFTLEGVQPGVYNTDLTVWIESELVGLQVARAARIPLDVEVR